MITANSVLLGIVALICFLGGINIIRKGASYFLPGGTPPQLVLDNLVRFLGGIYLGSGFVFAYAAWNTGSLGNLIYFMGIVVMFSGLGRLYSRYKVGSAGRYFDFIMVAEILLGLLIIGLKYLGA